MRISKISGFILFVLCSAFIVAKSYAQDTGLLVGIRGGASFLDNDESFTQFEAFVHYGLPWRWQFDSGWSVATEVGATLGVLEGGGDSAAIGTIIPNLALNKDWFTLRLGVGPTLLTDDQFGDEDFGTQFQFTSFLSLDFNVSPSLAIGYRIQHMSNAGIDDENPGLNLNMLQLSYTY